METFKKSGGARIGQVASAWPLAKLSVNSTSLEIALILVSKYQFKPSEVSSIEKVAPAGIQIFHTRRDYPAKIIFTCSHNPYHLIEKIKNTGFAPVADPAKVATSSKGLPLKWSFVIVYFVLWNGLIFQDMRSASKPDVLSIAALLLTALLAAAILKSKRLQQLVVADGHYFSEIQLPVTILCFIMSFMTVILSLTVMFERIG